jgi:hypothetical protein
MNCECGNPISWYSQHDHCKECMDRFKAERKKRNAALPYYIETRHEEAKTMKLKKRGDSSRLRPSRVMGGTKATYASNR